MGGDDVYILPEGVMLRVHEGTVGTNYTFPVPGGGIPNTVPSILTGIGFSRGGI